MLSSNTIIQYGKTLFVSFPKGASIIQTNLIFDYRFDDGSGQSVRDYKNARNAIIGSTSGSDSNDPTWSIKGLTLDGSDDLITGIKSAYDALGSGSFTIFISAMITNGSAPTKAAIFSGINTSKFDINCNGAGYGWQINLDTVEDTVKLASKSLNTLNTPVVIVARFISGSNVQIAVSNGSALSWGTATTTTGTSRDTTYGSDIQMGRFSTNTFFKGDAYYLAGYNTNLSDADCDTNYAAIKSILSGRGITL